MSKISTIEPDRVYREVQTAVKQEVHAAMRELRGEMSLIRADLAAGRPYLTKDDAAAYLGIAPATFHPGWTKRYNLPPDVSIGEQRYWSREALDAFLESQRRAA